MCELYLSIFTLILMYYIILKHIDKFIKILIFVNFLAKKEFHWFYSKY